METYSQQLATLFRNIVLNAAGVKRDFYELLRDRDVSRAIDMMQDRHEEVDEAIREYNPQTHEVMKRKNKLRRNAEPYITEKLPRTRQRYINEVELFFLLGADVKYHKRDGSDEAFMLFLDFIKRNRIHALHREFKRLAGSETEAAIVYHLYRDDDTGEMVCKPFVAARSKGYDIRPLFDQYGNMLSFAYGYKVKDGPRTNQHWDILTSKQNFECSKAEAGWRVEARENIVGKICAIYAQQPRAWDGVQQRIQREEFMDSKVADTNNYFADPVAYATADVVELMQKQGEVEMVGRLIQKVGKDSDFGYVNPPQNSEARRDEMATLHQSILFDSFTPDFSYESIKGMGSLSGEAMENAMILGFIKRANRMEVYGELFDREVSVIISVLKAMNPGMASQLDQLVVEVEFCSPFTRHNTSLWSNIAGLYTGGICSLETAVRLLAITEAPEEEIERIRQGQAESARMAMMVRGNAER